MNQSENMLKTVSAQFSFCSLLFSDEFPLDAIKSVHKCPLKPHNYRGEKKPNTKKKITILIEHSCGVAWEPVREAPPQSESELIRMTKSQDEGPHVEAIIEQGSCAGAVMEALVGSRSSAQPAAQA